MGLRRGGTCVRRALTWRNVQEKETTEEKLEKNYKKSSERKKESAKVVLYVQDVCSTCKRSLKRGEGV